MISACLPHLVYVLYNAELNFNHGVLYFRKYFKFQKVQCKLCARWTINLPRHMRGKKHGWSDSKSKYARLLFNMRARKADPTTSSRPLQAYKKCTYPGCEGQFVRLSLHVKACHSKEMLVKQKGNL